MLAAAREVRAFVDGVTMDAYLTDVMRQRAVERSIEIIGEAARGVSRELRESHPETEWSPIIAQRNMIAHEYAAVLPSRLWGVATSHVPVLIAWLEGVLPADPPA